jgi:hypothetical protein
VPLCKRNRRRDDQLTSRHAGGSGVLAAHATAPQPRTR